MKPVDISYRRIARITGPVLVTQASHTTMGVVDTVMVGRLGVTALGGVGVGNLLVWAVFSFFWGLLAGVNTLVAQAIGAGDRRAAGRAFWQGVYLALGSAVVIGLFWPLVPPLMRWVGASPEVQAVAGRYMQVRLLGGLGFALLLAADNLYRGLGHTRPPMWAGMVQAALNIALNYALIFGKLGAPALGTEGAAWGTVTAQTLVGAALLASVLGSRRLRRRLHLAVLWRFDPGAFATLVRLSLPIALQVFLDMGGITVFTVLVARLGDAQIAATNAVIQAWSVAYTAAYALSVGATTLVGQAVGAGREPEARRVMRRVLKLGVGVMAVPGVLYVLFPEGLMVLFVKASELDALLPYARPLFSIVAVCVMLDLHFNVLSGGLRGAGDTTYCMLVNLGSAWLLFVPAALLVTPRYGVVGAWTCMVLYLLAMNALFELRLRGRRWLRPVVTLTVPGATPTPHPAGVPELSGPPPAAGE